MLGALAGGLSVALGAFGAHALSATLKAHQRVDTFELASRYQFYHALALLVLGLIGLQLQNRWLWAAGFCFLGGMLVFSGSLYVLALTNLRWLGAITPLGGLALILGWVFLVIGVVSAE
ncbi:MAG: DUF423 domain-containing protein [Microscillaceae bacterium]